MQYSVLFVMSKATSGCSKLISESVFSTRKLQ